MKIFSYLASFLVALSLAAQSRTVGVSSNSIYFTPPGGTQTTIPITSLTGITNISQDTSGKPLFTAGLTVGPNNPPTTNIFWVYPADGPAISQAIQVGTAIPVSSTTSAHVFTGGHRYRAHYDSTPSIAQLYIGSTNNLTTFQITVWRQNENGNYNLVGTSEDFSSVLVPNAINTLYPTKLPTVLEGDNVGVYMAFGSAVTSLPVTYTVPNTYGVSGSVQSGYVTATTGFSLTSNTNNQSFFASQFNNGSGGLAGTNNAVVVALGASGQAPDFALVGSSMAGGLGGNTTGFYDGVNGDIWIPGNSIGDGIKAAGYKTVVINTSSQSSAAITTWFSNWVTPMSPKNVILMLGATDFLGATQTQVGIQNASSNLLANIQTLVNTAVSLGKNVYLVGQTPMFNYTGSTYFATNTYTANSISNINQIYRAGGITNITKFIDIEPIVAVFDPAGPTGNRWTFNKTFLYTYGAYPGAGSSLYTLDFLHPSAYLNRKIADFIVKSVTPVKYYPLVETGGLLVHGSIAGDGQTDQEILVGRNAQSGKPGHSLTIISGGAATSVYLVAWVRVPVSWNPEP
jgi:hypothetical protein